MNPQELCNFFTYLFTVKKLQPVTIKGYRSAISYVYKLMKLDDPGTDYFISTLIPNFEKELPRALRLFPKWSLDIVLQYLNSANFNKGPLSLLHQPHFQLLSISVFFFGDFSNST